ncbi:MAG: hypothetical protein IE929_11765 [Rhizorhabdus sp.]|jgi:hypothetical protein|nr:hypothetical protein [Rhizorhabdus sp.]
MRATLCLIGAMLMTTALPVQAARLAPEARIAKELSGRVAGKPVDCIPLHQIRSTEIFERTAILYKVGSTWYLNRPTSGANFLDRDDILVTDTRSPNLCSIDIVRLIDQGTRFPGGSIGLGSFVPYNKPKG